MVTNGGDTTAAVPHSPKLPQEEIDKSVIRLYSSHRKQRDLPPIVPRKVMSKDKEEASIRRLYEQAVQQHKKKLEEAEKKAIALSGVKETKKIDESELSDMVQRVYQRSIDAKNAQSARLGSRYVSPPKEHRLTREAQAEMSERMYDKARARSTESRTRLFEKYVIQPLPKMPKLSADEWKTTTDRLYVKK